MHSAAINFTERPTWQRRARQRLIASIAFAAMLVVAFLGLVKFAPSRAPQKRPIWENVERDQLGRRILVSGDCYRVVDDPSAVNNEIFRMFQQYMVYCSKQGSSPQELPWVEAIRDRYDYLTQQATVGADDRTDLFATLQ
jgi:hypothetical protein